MAIKVQGEVVINDDKKGLFKQINPGSYTTAERDALSPATGDLVYNSDDQELQLWDGSQWAAASASATNGVIDNFTIVDDDTTDNDRFTSSSFTGTVTMQQSGSPTTTKALKGTVTAVLDIPTPLDESLDTVTNSVTTNEFDTPIEGMRPQAQLGGGNYMYQPIFINDPLFPRFQIIERNDSNSGTIRISQFVDIDSPHLNLYSITSQGTGDPGEAKFNYKNGVVFSPFHGAETNSGVIWVADDVTNSIITATDTMYTSDGNTIVKMRKSGGYYYSSLGTFSGGKYNSGSAGSASWSSETLVFSGGVYCFHFHDHVNNNVVAITRSGSTLEVRTSAFSTTGDGTATMQSWVTNGSYSTNTAQIYGGYDFGVNGQYLIIATTNNPYTLDLYKWNTLTQQLDRKGQLPVDVERFGLAYYDNVLYYSTNINTITLRLYKSTSDGAYWTLLRDDSYPFTSGPGYYWETYGLAIGLNVKLFGLQTVSGSLGSVQWLLHTKVSDQTATITTASNLSAWSNTESIAKQGDENNPAYRGVIANINYSNGSFKLITSGEWSAGDVVVSTARTTSTSVTKYLTIDSVGNVSDLVTSDPGYVSQGLGETHTITFPATLPSGNAPDTELPEGTTLQFQLQTTNGAGTDTAISNSLTPPPAGVITTPVITAPVQDTAGTAIPRQMTSMRFVASNFEVNRTDFVKVSATWEVSTDAAFTSPMIDTKAYATGNQTLSETDRSNIILNADQTYYVRVKYNGTLSGTAVSSPYSSVIAARLNAQPTIAFTAFSEGTRWNLYDENHNQINTAGMAGATLTQYWNERPYQINKTNAAPGSSLTRIGFDASIWDSDPFGDSWTLAFTNAENTRLVFGYVISSSVTPDFTFTFTNAMKDDGSGGVTSAVLNNDYIIIDGVADGSTSPGTIVVRFFSDIRSIQFSTAKTSGSSNQASSIGWTWWRLQDINGNDLAPQFS